MELKLQTFSECCSNVDMFMPYSEYIYAMNGRFVVYSLLDNMPYRFEWYANGQLHRLDGPAIIHNCNHQWWIMNEYIHVENQAEFERWIVEKL